MGRQQQPDLHRPLDGRVVHCGTLGLTNCSNITGGWLAGFGFEYAFTNTWTVKFEYDYFGLGNPDFLHFGHGLFLRR